MAVNTWMAIDADMVMIPRVKNAFISFSQALAIFC